MSKKKCVPKNCPIIILFRSRRQDETMRRDETTRRKTENSVNSVQLLLQLSIGTELGKKKDNRDPHLRRTTIPACNTIEKLT